MEIKQLVCGHLLLNVFDDLLYISIPSFLVVRNQRSIKFTLSLLLMRGNNLRKSFALWLLIILLEYLAFNTHVNKILHLLSVNDGLSVAEGIERYWNKFLALSLDIPTLMIVTKSVLEIRIIKVFNSLVELDFINIDILRVDSETWDSLDSPTEEPEELESKEPCQFVKSCIYTSKQTTQTRKDIDQSVVFEGMNFNLKLELDMEVLNIKVIWIIGRTTTLERCATFLPEPNCSWSIISILNRDSYNLFSGVGRCLNFNHLNCLGHNCSA